MNSLASHTLALRSNFLSSVTKCWKCVLASTKTRGGWKCAMHWKRVLHLCSSICCINRKDLATCVSQRRMRVHEATTCGECVHYSLAAVRGMRQWWGVWFWECGGGEGGHWETCFFFWAGRTGGQGAAAVQYCRSPTHAQEQRVPLRSSGGASYP